MRNTTDFNYEMELAAWNGKLGIETLFIPCKEGYEKISSSSVRNLAQYGKDVSEYMPEITRTRWFKKPKRIIVTGFIGSGKSSYIDAFFRGKYDCFDMDEIAKKRLDAGLRNDIADGIASGSLDSAKLDAAGQILLEEILAMPKNAVIEASALGTYTRFLLNPLRKLYDDAAIMRVDKFHSDKVRKIDENFKQAVLRIQTKPLVTDFVINDDLQNADEIAELNARAVSLLER
jgi:hypothetical protein